MEAFRTTSISCTFPIQMDQIQALAVKAHCRAPSPHFPQTRARRFSHASVKFWGTLLAETRDLPNMAVSERGSTKLSCLGCMLNLWERGGRLQGVGVRL
jgi:hypothetical protein